MAIFIVEVKLVPTTSTKTCSFHRDVPSPAYLQKGCQLRSECEGSMPGKPYEENPSPSGPLITLTLQSLWSVEEIPPLDRRLPQREGRSPVSPLKAMMRRNRRFPLLT